MSKHTLKSLLQQFVKHVSIDGNGLVNTESLDLGALQQIVDERLCDEGLDFNLLWEALFYRTVKAFYDFQNPDKEVTQEKKDAFVERAHKMLSEIPFTYYFYYKLPANYPSPPGPVNDEFEIVLTDEAFMERLKKANPQTPLATALSGRSDHRLLEANKKYLRLKDKGLVLSGVRAFLESKYGPERIVGIFYGLHLVLGNLDTESLAQDIPGASVYDAKYVFRANFVTPVKRSKAAHLQFRCTDDQIQAVNPIFIRLVTHQEPQAIEEARIQICNSLYWYFEFLNAEETALQIVFLVSAFDSLFPPRKYTVSGQKHTPTVLEKASLIAEITSDTEQEEQINLGIIERLFAVRNDVIHGKIEILGYSKSTRQSNANNRDLAQEAHDILKEYLRQRLVKFAESTRNK